MRTLALVMGLACGLASLRAAESPTPFRLDLDPGDREFVVAAPAPGVYWFRVRSRAKIPVGAEHTADFRWEDGIWRHRRLLEANKTDYVYGIDRIRFGAEPRRVRIRWKPDEVDLLELRFDPVQPVAVPEAARNYTPPFAPPARHPRLLVNPGALEKIKANLELGINAKVWESVADAARAPFVFSPAPDKEVMFDPEVARALSRKAFYHLVTGDAKIGREAVDLALAYLARVSFGNGQDICRKVGEIIHRTSQVYDWCHALATPEERTFLREKMLYLAAEMEIGWPPFLDSVAVGHGNEAQMSRDLLSMAIAVHDEDPEPCRYALYTMLEVLQPSKSYLYQSGRHDQGSGYAYYRYKHDLFAALQMRRTFGYDLLPPVAAEVPYYWYYIRTPDNRYMIEGDANWNWRTRYYGTAEALLSVMALWGDPEFKSEYARVNPKLDFPEDPVFFLLVNDPALKAEDRRASLPLTKFYRKPLPGMAIRTGWNFHQRADDVVVNLQGAYYHYRNHQHLDMGSFQIYYRGNLAADLGQYKTYGVPYDWNFNKSSASHSVMLFRDPEQKSYRMGPEFTANSGTQEVAGWWPASDLKEQTRDDTFRNGDTPRAGWGPVADRPLYSFMETDLGILYPNRVKSYSRSFAFLNLGPGATPAALLVLDRFEKAADRVEPIFQLTSIATPTETDGRIEVAMTPYRRTGKLGLQTLLPKDADQRILTGKATHTLDGQYFQPVPADTPEAKGSRTEIRGSGNTFLHLIQIQDGAAKPLPADVREHGGRIAVDIADRRVDFGDALRATDAPVAFETTRDDTQVLLLDLAPGTWELRQAEKVLGRAEVLEAEGSFFAILNPGTYTLTPAAGSTAPELAKSTRAAVVTPPPAGVKAPNPGAGH